MEGTYKVLELLEHPGKSLGSNTDIILVKTGLLVDDAWFTVSYLDDVDVRKGSGLGGNVSRGSDQGGEDSRTTSTRARNSSPDISRKGARSSKIAS